MGVAEQNRAIALPRRPAMLAGWLCAAALLAVFVWRTAVPAAGHTTYAFSAYYTAARLTLSGQAGVRFCTPWFFDQQRALGFGDRADYFCPNPPTNALAFLPVAWLPPLPAQAAWVACDVLMLAAIAALGWRIVARAAAGGGAGAAVQFALVLGLIGALFRPLMAELRALQVYIVVALFYALWLYGYLARRDWVCGLALALLVLIKLSGWPLWLLMLAAGRWRALAWAVAIGTAIGLATLPLLTFEFWRVYMFQQVPAISADATNAVPAYQTLLSLLRQLFSYDARWAPRPLLDAPWLGGLLWWAAALGLLAPTLLAARRPRATGTRRGNSVTGWLAVGCRQSAATSDTAGGQPLAAARSDLLKSQTGSSLAIEPLPLAALCLVVPLQPAGEEHHYTLLMIVLLVLFSQPGLALLRSRAAVAGAALAVLLLILPSYFLQTAQWQGWPVALLAYPRLYGALILWGVLLFGRDRGYAQPAAPLEQV
jgi:hypothetical protein